MPTHKEIFERAQASLKGWFKLPSLESFIRWTQWQERRKITGDILEIGCYHGQSAASLAGLLQPGETLWLNDLFDLPESKDGHAWRGNTLNCIYLEVPSPEAVVANIRRIFGTDQLPIKTAKCSSLDLDVHFPEEKKFRFIHVDGRHDFKYVYKDLKWALSHIMPHGIVALDDWRNRDWPEVGEALIKHLQEWRSIRVLSHDVDKIYLSLYDFPED